MLLSQDKIGKVTLHAYNKHILSVTLLTGKMLFHVTSLYERLRHLLSACLARSMADHSSCTGKKVRSSSRQYEVSSDPELLLLRLILQRQAN